MGALATQCCISFAVLFVAGLVISVAGGTYDGIITVVGLILWPLMAASIATLGMVVVGLPLRLVPRLRDWWANNGEISLLGVLGGFALLVASVRTGRTDLVLGEDGYENSVFVPSESLLLLAWLLLSFSCTHLRWPRRWTRSIRR